MSNDFKRQFSAFRAENLDYVESVFFLNFYIFRDQRKLSGQSLC